MSIVFHKASVVEYSDGSIPAQTVIFIKNDKFKEDLYQKEIEQSWQFRSAREVLENSNCAILITEMMVRTLNPIIRAEKFHGVLAAVIEHTKPLAIVCKSSQQVIDPKRYLDSIKKAPIERPGSINVLFYNIQDSNGDMLMITSGLGAFGYSEIQCHFRKLEPGKVAAVLYSGCGSVFRRMRRLKLSFPMLEVAPRVFLWGGRQFVVAGRLLILCDYRCRWFWLIWVSTLYLA